MKPESRYEIDIVPNEHGGFYARVPDLPTLFTGGATPEAAMENALQAIGLMLEEVRDRGLPVPAPFSSYSGRFNVRVPRSLHRQLVRLAEREGVSLNAMVNSLLGRVVGAETTRGTETA
jgi:antitoxin HicB